MSEMGHAVVGLCLYALSALSGSHCWIFNVRPGEFVCTPLNFLCSYSEECCLGVCYRRTYLKYIKIRQCTLGNKIIGFPREDELNYYGTKDMRKLVRDRPTEPGHVKGEIELQYDREQSREPLDIYKPVAIPIPTKSSAAEDATPASVEATRLTGSESFRVDRNSSMYGGPLDLSGNFSMPSDDLHLRFLTPCSDRETNGSSIRNTDISRSVSPVPSTTDRASYIFGYRINPAGDTNFQTIEDAAAVVETSPKLNFTKDELREFEDFTDLNFLKPTVQTVTVSNEMKAAQIKENLENFIQNEGTAE